MRSSKRQLLFLGAFAFCVVVSCILYGVHATRIEPARADVTVQPARHAAKRVEDRWPKGTSVDDYGVIANRNLFQSILQPRRPNASPSPLRRPATSSLPPLQTVAAKAVLPSHPGFPPKPEPPPAEKPTPVVQGPSPPAAVQADGSAAPEVTFTGLVHFGGQEWIVLEQPRTGDGVLVQAGDSAFGVTVIRAEPRRALVEWNGQEVWLWAGVGRGREKPAVSQAPGKKPQAVPPAVAPTGAARTDAQVRAETAEVMKRADVAATYSRVYQQYPQEGAQIAGELGKIAQTQGWAAWEARARELGVLVEKE
jgi:hypothetical protein